MSDFLAHIAARTLEPAGAVRPRTRARFEPPPDAIATEPFAATAPAGEAPDATPHERPMPTPSDAAVAPSPPHTGPDASSPIPVEAGTIRHAPESPVGATPSAPESFSETDPNPPPPSPMRPPRLHKSAAPPASPVFDARSETSPDKDSHEIVPERGRTHASPFEGSISDLFPPDPNRRPHFTNPALAPSRFESPPSREPRRQARSEEAPSTMRPEIPGDFASDEARPGVVPRTPSPEVSTPSPMLAPPPLAVPPPAPTALPAEAAPAIHVSIGRVVVCAVTPPAPPHRKEAAPSNVMTLDDYLSRRKKRGRA